MPMNRSGRLEFLARPVIGSVEVLEAKIASSAITASTFSITSFLTCRSLEDRLDDEAGILEIAVVRRRCDARK